MTSSEDFKQAIRSGNINEAFLVAMSNAPELNITTSIITADGDRSRGDNSLHTHVSLIEGKIANEIGEQLIGDRYAEIQQFHIEQVTQGHQTIQNNLISLQKMFQLMSAFQEQQDGRHSNWVDIAADAAREPLPTRKQANKLYSKRTPEALAAGKAKTNVDSDVDSELEADDEPQLPSFVPEAEDDELVNDLLSLTDLDDEDEDKSVESTATPQAEGDWGEWLEEEPEVKSEVFDLKSLNIREAAQNWQNWESSDSSDSQSPQS